MGQGAPRANLATVRRLEAAGFRAWPARQSLYDGTWLLRLTPDHASKRLNCVNPLDPADGAEAAPRLAEAARRFAAAGQVLTVRQSPLAPAPLVAHMAAAGWRSFSESIVMAADLGRAEPPGGVDLLPVRDLDRFAAARARIEGEADGGAAAIAAVIGRIEAETGLFLLDNDAFGPAAVCLLVHDRTLAGILQLAVHAGLRRQGTGSAILSAGLRWARLRGAEAAWLQVDAVNLPALALYRAFGFEEIYRYRYWRPAP
ncbi:GNAT family N-acetyltransferase [Ensifer soli]|uniref:GNAT family N-acetyltransferase n=1 Tax=Ciceribacter sp. sgz301302 TaxID=3342379 RepID=UPI0035BB53ED